MWRQDVQATAAYCCQPKNCNWFFLPLMNKSCKAPIHFICRICYVVVQFIEVIPNEMKFTGRTNVFSLTSS